MADIFISYSKQDQEQARLLAAVLEAEGYAVWWDASLLSGDNYRKVIMTELGRARATIVIWTENSIHSDWVQSEAGRAHADRRLIPVKAKGLSYKDIPPPFDNMHIENLDDREKILAAVVALLAKPEVAPSPLRRVSKRARLELLSWVGIAGAVITVTTNLQSLLTLSKWLRQLLESWIAVITFVWGRVFFFLPKMYAPDAVQLTFLLFVIVNLAMCSRARQGSELNTSRMAAALRSVSVGIAAVLISLVFILGTIVAGVPADQDGYSVVFIDRSWFIVKYLQDMNAPVPVHLDLVRRIPACRVSASAAAGRHRLLAAAGGLLVPPRHRRAGVPPLAHPARRGRRACAQPPVAVDRAAAVGRWPVEVKEGRRPASGPSCSLAV